MMEGGLESSYPCHRFYYMTFLGSWKYIGMEIAPESNCRWRVEVNTGYPSHVNAWGTVEGPLLLPSMSPL